MTAGAAPRRLVDACPGVDRPFSATDGSIVRVRTAGRPVTVTALSALLDIVAAQGDPAIQLTSRGALQLRGLADPLPPAVRSQLIASGLVPSPSHELVRNIVASPLSGLDDAGTADVRPAVAALDEGLCADPTLAALPGRFLFAVDDGRGDVAAFSFDVGILATGDGLARVLAGSGDRGWVVPLEAAAPLALDVARDFLRARQRLGSTAWHVRELGKPVGPGGSSGAALPSGGPATLGAHGSRGEHAVVGVPLGLLTPGQVRALSDVTAHVLVTPWRSLVIPYGATHLERLSAAGLAVTPESPWARLHACAGLPGCARSAIDTHALARALAHALPPDPAGRPVHVSGCARRCGAPTGDHAGLLAPKSLEEALQMLDTA